VVAAGYDRIATSYADWQAGIEGDPRDRYVARLLSALPMRARILEIGCGPGVEPTPTLAARGQLTAIDISRVQLELARAAVPSALFVHGDVTTAEFDVDWFDAVVALYVLSHLPGAEQPELMRRIGTWLAPVGCCSRRSARAGRTRSWTIGSACRCTSAASTDSRTSA